MKKCINILVLAILLSMAGVQYGYALTEATIPTTAGSTLKDGYQYNVTTDVTITATEAGVNGLKMADNATGFESADDTLDAYINGEAIQPNSDITLTDTTDLVIITPITVNSVNFYIDTIFVSYSPQRINTYSAPAAPKTRRWGTVCAPFELTSIEGEVQYFILKEVGDSTMFFKKVESVPANTPAVYLNPNGGGLKASAGVTTLSPVMNPGQSEASDWSLVGTFKRDTISNTSNIFYCNQNRFLCGSLAKNPIPILPFRAYFITSQSSPKIRPFNIAIYDGEDPTAIGTVDADGNINITDCKYIENGQLIILKNSKKYNAAGQELK